METTTLILLLSLLFCHFLADYTHLSTKWMLDAKRLGKPLFPIFNHATVHGILMFITLVIFSEFLDSLTEDRIYELAAFQISTHFLIDVWKGRMNGWFPALQSPTNKWHWIVFGFDQFLHGVVILLMVYMIK